MEVKRNILLCVAGGTPAIITETLWALMQKGEAVDEIRVITTREGREKLLTGKLNGRGAPDESLLDAEHGKFYKFQKDYPEYAGNIRFDKNVSLYILTQKQTGVPNPRDIEDIWLDDILTDADNAKIANQICEIVREMSADENVRIHASIAGGRKTMSLYLMTAMQLFGREDDVMSHVLVSKEIEFGAPKFFYKTPQPEPILDFKGEAKKKNDETILTTDDVEIYLAEIPFIKLRGLGGDLFHKPITNFGDFVRNTQRDLNYLENANRLVLDFDTQSIKVFNRQVTLSLKEFFVYVLFAYFRKRGIGEHGFVGFDEISKRDTAEVCRIFTDSDDDMDDDDDSAIELFRENFKKSTFIYNFDRKIVKQEMLEELQKNFLKHNLKSPNEAKVTDKEVEAKLKNNYSQTVSKAKKEIEEAGIDDRFNFVKVGEYGFPLCGLEIEPDKIIFKK